jgi:hypothetical protein
MKPTASQLLETPGAMLNRTHLAELGWGRAQVDAILLKLTVYVIDGSSRPMVRVADYLDLVDASACPKDQVRLTNRGRLQ